jgi:hypothetical protein
MQTFTFDQTTGLGGERYAVEQDDLLVAKRGKVRARILLAELESEPTVTRRRSYFRSAAALVLAVGAVALAWRLRSFDNLPAGVDTLVLGSSGFVGLLLLWLAVDGLRTVECATFADRGGKVAIAICKPRKEAAALAYEEFVSALRERIRASHES